MTLDDVVALLNEHHQRATYGAVAGIVGGAANGLMNGRPKSREDSWVVAKTTKRKSGSRRGWPTGYKDNEIHPECLDHIKEKLNGFISDTDELKRWLTNQTSVQRTARA